METLFKTNPLTEEQKAKVRKYFAENDKSGVSESRLRFRYGRMKAEGETIPDAEVYLQFMKERQQAEYAEQKQEELDQKLNSYRIEEDDGTADYEIVRRKERADTDSIVVGVLGVKDGKPHRFITTEIVEKENPKFFYEKLCKYRKENQTTDYKPAF